MEAGHGGVLVRQLRDRARVEGPQRAVAGEGVDEAVRVRKQPRRCGGEQREADQGDGGEGGQGVAGSAVGRWASPEEHHEDSGGDDEVERSVEEVGNLDEPLVVEGGVLDGLLAEHVEQSFEVDDPLGVGEGPVVGDRGGALQVPYEAVDAVEDGGVADLPPPPQWSSRRRCGLAHAKRIMQPMPTRL